MPVLSFGEWRPDVSDYSGSTSKNILNVVPRGDGYGPFPSFNKFSSSLPAVCRGYFYARKNDGTIAVFAGTSTRLYLLSNTDGTWTDASKSSNAYSALSASAMWQFAQFNNLVFATQVNAPLQVYDLTSGSTFVDGLGSPPQAAYIAVVNRFLVLSGLASPTVYRVQWSGLNDVNSSASWTSGVNSSDSQDLPDGGIVRGVAGGESGVIFQDASIRRMTFAPGSPYVFGIDRISQDDGIYAPGSLIAAGDRVFFCSPAGFKVIPPGGFPTPIGKEKIDRTFFGDVDTGNLQLVIGAHDPQHTRVYWAYKSINGTVGQFDSVLCYDWVLDRWSKLMVSGEYIASLSKPGITLEAIDTLFGTNIDTITLSSLDAISNASIAALSSFDSTHSLGFFNSSNLEASLETPEQGGDGKRFRVTAVRVVTDAPTVFVSVSKRESAQAAATYSDETQIDSTGQAPQNVSTRYARGKIRIPAGTAWTFAAGVEPEIRPEGQR